MKKLEDIFTRLGLDSNNGLFITEDGLWEKVFHFPIVLRRLLRKRK